ncbi:hypothetical protein [Sphingomonas arantia]
MMRLSKIWIGWLVAILILAIPIFGLGWARTTAPVAAPLEAGNLVLRLEAVKIHESFGFWPIIFRSNSPNTGPIRGNIRNRNGTGREIDYKITISSQRGAEIEARCNLEYHDACYFDADLGVADLTEGILVSVANTHDGQILVSRHRVNFTRTSTYSFALWDALMGV